MGSRRERGSGEGGKGFSRVHRRGYQRGATQGVDGIGDDGAPYRQGFVDLIEKEDEAGGNGITPASGQWQ